MLDLFNKVNTLEVVYYTHIFLCKSWAKHTDDPCILDIVANDLKLDLKEIDYNSGVVHTLYWEKKQMSLNWKFKNYHLKTSYQWCSTPETGTLLSGVFTKDKIRVTKE